MLWQLILLNFLQLLVLPAFALSSPPSGAITIGQGGKYATISAAMQDSSSSVSDHLKLRERVYLFAVLGVFHFLGDLQGTSPYNQVQHQDLWTNKHAQLIQREQCVANEL